MKPKKISKINSLATQLLIIGFISAHQMFSQKLFEDYQFISIKEGISKRAVTSITQDHYGYMWIGTYGAGLYKYDGINYTGFEFDWQKRESINSNLIYCTYVDSDNTIWIGTDQGICFYNRELNKFKNINLKVGYLKNTKNDIGVKSIIQDDFGNVILGTYGFGAFRLNLKTHIVTIVNSDISSNRDYQINCLSKNKKGVIYFGTSFGLKELEPNGKLIKKVLDKNNNQLGAEYIESIVVDKNQNLWLGSFRNGLRKITVTKNNFSEETFSITKKRIISILNLPDNSILCGTENDGLFLIGNNGNVIHKYENNTQALNSLKSNSIWSLYLDKENRVWLGYYNKGVDVFDKLYSKFTVIGSERVNYPNTLQTGSVTGVAKDKSGNLWIGMEGGGVDIYNSSAKTFKHINSKNSTYFSGLKSNDIQTVFIDSKDNIWLGSWSEGIYFLKKGSNAFVNFNTNNTKGIVSNRMLSFSEDSKGVIWIGTYQKGLHYYIPTENKFYHCDFNLFAKKGMNDGNIRKVLVDSNDVLWIGSTQGLFKVTYDENFNFSVVSLTDKMMKDKNIQKAPNVLSLYESRDNTIWVGTDDAGLFCYNPKYDKFDWFYNLKGKKERSIAAIIQDQFGAIWVSGKSGISKIDIKNHKALNFTIDDGLLGNDFNTNSVLKDNDGKLYFGSYEGLNFFDPKQILKNRKEPFLYFSDFKLFNKSVSPTDEDSPLSKVISETDTLILNHNQSVFTIEYVGLNYSHPGKNEYAYYLDGFEKDWNYVGSKREATYTNLPAGDYVLNVKSADRGGIWSKKPLQLHITVLPPFWKTNWACLLYFLTVVVIGYFLKKYLQKRFQEKQAIQFEREKTIQIEKLNEKKLQFFTNISHEFRTPLTLIINPLEDILKNKSLGLPAEVTNKLQVIHKSSDRLSRLINELMDFNKLQFNKMTLHVQRVEVVGFVRNIFGYFEEEASSRNIELKFESNVENLYDWLDPKMFEKIIFNIISNAFKVTADRGVISIRIALHQEMTYLPLADCQHTVETFEIAIEDTGAGLNKKEIKKIFDRFYQVNNLNKTYYGSTGIGLEVVRGFVELHKGKIEVDSKLGVGTTFTVVFPLGNEYYDDSEILEEEYKIVLQEKLTSKTKIKDVDVPDAEENDRVYTILIVEDNAELRNYLKEELTKTYKVIEAENGQKGFDLAMKKLPDLILTDVIMPVMDGLELCKRVKADLKTSHIPLLMLSAKALVQDRLDGIDSGADIYMSKPFDIDVLKSSLWQLINSRQIMFNKFYKGITKNAKEKTTTLDNDFIQKTLNYIHENISEPELSVEVLASKVFLSRSQLYRKLRTLTGVSVNEFIRNVRLEKAKELIHLGNHNINEISYKVGFTSASYFTKCYKAKYGHLPTQSVKVEEGLD